MNRHQQRSSRQQKIWNNQQLRNKIKELNWLYNYYRYYSGRSTMVDFNEFIESEYAAKILQDYRRCQQYDNY